MKHKQLIFILLLSLPCLAQAHSMQFSTVNWFSGFMHPLQGVDHIVAMIAVGLWAVQLRAVFLLPMTFLIVMSLGGIIGSLGFELPNVETWILVSSIVLAILVIKKQSFSMSINALIVAASAFFHGYAHGYELADKTNLWSYSIGFVTATLLLHGIGIVLMMMFSKRYALAR
jgi:urease accessory protein